MNHHANGLALEGASITRASRPEAQVAAGAAPPSTRQARCSRHPRTLRAPAKQAPRPKKPAVLGAVCQPTEDNGPAQGPLWEAQGPNSNACAAELCPCPGNSKGMQPELSADKQTAQWPSCYHDEQPQHHAMPARNPVCHNAHTWLAPKWLRAIIHLRAQTRARNLNAPYAELCCGMTRC